jgi:alginate O-acetyltransferase complex protein AlgI
MIFSSLEFLFLFLPIVLLLIAIWKNTTYQNTILFISSLLFYAWGGVSYTAIMLSSIILNYVAGIGIGKFSRKKLWLTIAIILNLSSLAFFKYFNFLVDNYNILISVFKISPVTVQHIILPIGISFYTFQGISYLIDVYKKTVEPQRSFIKLGTYIALFPQLIAGPIIRYNEIQPQLTCRNFNRTNFYDGIKRFTFGLARKVIIANQIAIMVDDIFSRPPSEIPTLTAWIGIVGYTLQVYHDFAGYSDMAIGLGKMLGFNFPENFNYPYLAKSIGQFWQRWHMTLSNWFKNYLYFPLGGSRCGSKRVLLNLYIVFFCTGLWHGASWNFVIWGLIHGTFMVLERQGLSRLLSKSFGFVQYFYALFVIILSRVFFRTEDMTSAIDYMKTLFGGSTPTIPNIYIYRYFSLDFIIIVIISILASTKFFELINNHINKSAQKFRFVFHLKHVFIILGIFLVLFIIINQLVIGSYNPFIYYRF